MTRHLLSGNAAAAWGARLARADYVPAFPITPQTEIIETLAGWIESGAMPGRLTLLESEHSMLTAACAAAVTGVRVFTATSSQGLLYALEMIYAAPGLRAPFVLVNVSRGVQTPVTLEPDHTDVLAARDSGFLQLHCATCQEVLDSILIAYRLAEHPDVRLPVLVNLDGFYLSFTREPVLLPSVEQTARFLPPFTPENLRFRADQPVAEGAAVLGSAAYSYFRYQSHLAALAALPAFEAICAEFDTVFGRSYSIVEAYRMEDADDVFLMIGCFATKAKAAVDRLRDAGRRVGLLRPRLTRPWPEAGLQRWLLGRRTVMVVDQNLSMGKGGVLATELASSLYGRPDAPRLLSFIGGLGGRDIGVEEFHEMAAIAQRSADTGATPPPRLLYTADELREVRKLQAIAHNASRRAGEPS